MKKYSTLILAILIAFSLPALAEEGPQVDFILLVDTSLSMAPAIDELKQFVASAIVGRFVQQGDWVAVLAFYRESKLIWEGDIQTEADKAALVRSLHALEANGKFTDIGAALDDLKQLVIRRNKPEIPKYILLLTDEVQEAPPGSKYPSEDFTVSHELLEYVRRVDRGSFQAITIGYGLASRIESDLASLMKTLNEPPERPSRFLPGDDSIHTKDASSQDPEASPATDASVATGMDSSRSETDTSGSGIPGPVPTGSQADTATRTGTESGSVVKMPVYLVLALVMAIAILGSITLMTQRSKKVQNPGKPPQGGDKEVPSGLKDGRQ